MSIYKLSKFNFLHWLFLSILDLFSATTIVGFAWILSKIVSDIISHKNAPLNYLQYDLIAMVILVILRALSSFLFEYFSGQIGLRSKENVKEVLLESNLAFSEFGNFNHSSGKYINITVNSVESLKVYFGEFLPSIVSAIITPIALIIFIFFNDLTSFAILICVLPLMPIFMILIGLKAKKLSDQQLSVLNKISGYFLDTIQGITTLKVLGLSKIREERISEFSEQFRKSTMQVLKVAFLSSLTLELLATLSTAVIAVSIGVRLFYGDIQYQEALFILVLTPSFFAPLRQIGAKYISSKEALSVGEEICKLFESAPKNIPKEEFKVSSKSQTLQFNSFETNNINFSYPSLNKGIRNFSLKISAGEKILLKGVSGSGKTTLLKIISGLIKVDDGIVNINGEKIETTLPYWREIISYVPQTPYVFNSSIKDNILIGKEIASEEEIEIALERSLLKDFVYSLENGINTIIGERGVALSGGQLQKLSLCRAFIKNAQVFIMDEPTSFLDIMSEEQLVLNLKNFAKDKTVVSAAHRINLFKDYDQIIDTTDLFSSRERVI